MAFASEQLYATPNALAPHYSRFGVADRLLLTGHSHQAWPDVAYAGQRRAWLDAAECADLKWERAFACAARVREGWSRLLDDPDGLYSLGPSTHDLLVRFLSALPFALRPQLVMTDGEFHSMRRQAAALERWGLEVVRVPALPAESVAERLAAETTDRTAAVMTSTVFYRDARIAGDLGPAAEACRRHGAHLLLDVYHQLDAVPFSLRERDLEDAYVVGGGYKYCQLGEGNCFLRFPADCDLRPVVRGWFAEFGDLATAGDPEGLGYARGHGRFDGATYDPTSHYRAAAVFDFFDAHGLEPAFLRDVSQHQIGLLARGVDALDLDPALLARDRSVPLAAIGGFLALESPRAGDLAAALRERGVLTDYRDTTLRLGPAPYLSDRQLEDAIARLGDAVRAL